MIVRDSIREYHSKSGMSKTKLWRIIEKNPQWFKHCLDNPPESDSPALLFGAALHKAVLEPDGFDNEYIVRQKVDGRTIAGKEYIARFEAERGDREIIMQEDKAIIDEMVAAVRTHKYADFLTRGIVEQSIYWTDELTGVECQARPDCFKIVGERGAIVDVKTCVSADTDSMIRAAVNFGYDMQAAMFKIGCEKEYGIPCDFIFVAIEKTPPYMINILRADELMLKYGEDRFRTALGIYKECSESGNWYGYNGFSGIINNLSLPAWLAKEVE